MRKGGFLCQSTRPPTSLVLSLKIKNLNNSSEIGELYFRAKTCKIVKIIIITFTIDKFLQAKTTVASAVRAMEESEAEAVRQCMICPVATLQTIT